jgi:hypothetical protein
VPAAAVARHCSLLSRRCRLNGVLGVFWRCHLRLATRRPRHQRRWPRTAARGEHRTKC